MRLRLSKVAVEVATSRRPGCGLGELGLQQLGGFGEVGGVRVGLGGQEAVGHGGDHPSGAGHQSVPGVRRLVVSAVEVDPFDPAEQDLVGTVDRGGLGHAVDHVVVGVGVLAAGARVGIPGGPHLRPGKIVLQNTGQALLVDENVRKVYLGED